MGNDMLKAGCDVVNMWCSLRVQGFKKTALEEMANTIISLGG